MSVIYSAGQFEDAFCPRKLGNWEAGAKEACPYTIQKDNPGASKTEIIVDSRGHLLPWIPRDKSTTWGLLNYFMQSKYGNSLRQTLTMMSGPGRQSSSSNILKRFKKLPTYNSQKVQEQSTEDKDILLEYLQDLCLPIVWIIGPPTKNTINKRKLFTKQLASKLGFGYVNLDEKIQEWKERQTTCTCPHPHFGKNTCNATANANSLASTSIAPSKLPTNVSPKISSELPVPPETPHNQAHAYSLTMLDSQRITFDTALPIERNKILELYKFAMAECLPCGGFILDTVPFDLVEGLAFEKVFYPAALAIYFTEGVPQKRNLKPKDRRVTATAVSSTGSQSKYLMNPNDPKVKKAAENQYVKMKSHKRLGTFNLAEGEKICRRFGSKTIRIINAEDVEKDTMDFLNELVKKNLEKYEQIINGEGQLDVEDAHVFARGGNTRPGPPSSTYSAFISEGREVDDDLLELEEEERKAYNEIQEFMKHPPPPLPKSTARENPNEFVVGPSAELGAPLISEKESRTSLMTLPNYPSDITASSASSSAIAEELPRDDEIPLNYIDQGGAGDTLQTQEGSVELWQKIMKLETKVAELNPEEEEEERVEVRVPSSKPKPAVSPVPLEGPLPPPTAYAQQEEDNRLTTAIRNALVPNFIPQECLLPKLRTPSPPDYDFGASGDNVDVRGVRTSPVAQEKNNFFMFGKPPSQQSSSSEHDSIASKKGHKSNKPSSQEDDSFYDM